MDSLTLTPSTFFIEGVAGDVTYNAATVLATFKPAATLAVNTTYTIMVTTGVQDMGGVPMFDPPGSVQTNPMSINEAGAITGYYVDAGNMYHGFLRAADGTFTTFAPLGSPYTYPNSINPAGAITGFYVDTSGRHGFLRSQ